MFKTLVPISDLAEVMMMLLGKHLTKLLVCWGCLIPGGQQLKNWQKKEILIAFFCLRERLRIQKEAFIHMIFLLVD